ncbi:MAG TPA: hypothetical protein VMF08_13410 [Candidatus Sulfotelmatobacter sp.]|nr:hypothetical protein [Candidatus Sulfotelmatobacter sp.]
MSKGKIERDYHPNGQLRWQATIKDGKPVGIVRHWHENGVLADESFCDDDGLEHGVVKTWNKEGKLLGECHMDHGTGISKSWYENDQLESESYHIRGIGFGRSRMWWEDGTLMSVTYYLKGCEVSKKKYLAACEKDPTLPRYEDNEPEPEEPEFIGVYKKRETPISEWERQKFADHINKYLRKPNRGEALQWLKGDENRWLGDMTHEDSVELVEEGYKAGATKIVAVEIGDETSDRLIVYVPLAGAKRESVFKWHSIVAQKCGWDPDGDWGQDELFIFLD